MISFHPSVSLRACLAYTEPVEVPEHLRIQTMSEELQALLLHLCGWKLRLTVNGSRLMIND